MPAWFIFVITGILSGITAGFFGVGGGIILVPALMSWAGFSQHRAIGTSLAVILLPIGLAATLEYYRHGNVDIRAAVILAITMIISSWIGAFLAGKMSGPHLRLLFGVFVLGMGIYLTYGACRRLGWF